MKKSFFLKTAFVFALCFAQFANAEGIRGRLDGVGPYGLYPVPGIAVTVASPGGRSAPVYSDYRGMYYMFGLRPGRYTLEIWAGGPQPMRFGIQVYRGQPMTDIAPIRVR